MKYLLGCACAVALGCAAAVSVSADDSDRMATLSGCLIRGNHGYLMTNTGGEPAFQRADGRRIEPGPVGTAGAGATVFYWLDDDHDLAKHVGHQVEVVGELKGDVKPGEIKIDRKDKWTSVEIKSGGRSLKADVPEALWVVSRQGISKDDKMNILVRRFDTKRVRMLEARCD